MLGLACGGGGDRICDSLSIDHILDVLNHPVRRKALGYLQSVPDRTIPVDDLVDHLDAAERQAGEPTSRRYLRLRLTHIHLPKLAARDVIEFDPNRGVLRYHPDDGLETWLRQVREWDRD